jgi:bifunctional non-homologous end joining protein LigD
MLYRFIDVRWEFAVAEGEGFNDLARESSHVAFTASFTTDGEAMHQATRAVGAEGIVNKKTASVYLPGQRVRWWTKTKHRRTNVFPVVGWRPSTPFRPGGLILAEAAAGHHGERLGVVRLGDGHRVDGAHSGTR